MNIEGDERSYEIKDTNIDGEDGDDGDDGDDDGNEEDVRFSLNASFAVERTTLHSRLEFLPWARREIIITWSVVNLSSLP